MEKLLLLLNSTIYYKTKQQIEQWQISKVIGTDNYKEEDHEHISRKNIKLD